MLWLAGVWIFFLVITTIGGARIDVAERKPTWYIAAGLLTGALCALFVAMHFKLASYNGQGTILIFLSVSAGGWVVYEGVRDIVEERRDGTSGKTLLIAATAASLLYLPAVGLGLLHGWRLLNTVF